MFRYPEVGDGRLPAAAGATAGEGWRLSAPFIRLDIIVMVHLHCAAAGPCGLFLGGASAGGAIAGALRDDVGGLAKRSGDGGGKGNHGDCRVKYRKKERYEGSGYRLHRSRLPSGEILTEPPPMSTLVRPPLLAEGKDGWNGSNVTEARARRDEQVSSHRRRGRRGGEGRGGEGSVREGAGKSCCCGGSCG
jgi:hypothetical protein